MITVIITFLAGIFIGAFLFFAYVFKINLKSFQVFISNTKSLEDTIEKGGDFLKKNYASYTDQNTQILTKEFEDQISKIVSNDPKFIQNSYGDKLALEPIDDRIVLAWRMIFYHKVMEAENLLKSNNSNHSLYDKNSWIWIPKQELFDYAEALMNAPEEDLIDGCRIYFGTIDKAYLDQTHYQKNKTYYDAKQGALIPFFVTTNSKGGGLNDDPTRQRSDCNCGNPPGSVNCSVGGRPSRSYQCNDLERQRGKSCERCPNP